MVTSVVNAGGGIYAASDGNTTVIFKDADGDGKLSKGDNLSIVSGRGAYTLNGQVGDGQIVLAKTAGDPHAYKGVISGSDFTKLEAEASHLLGQAKAGSVADDGTIDALAADGLDKNPTGTGGGVQSSYIADFQSNVKLINGEAQLGIDVVKDQAKGVAVQKNVDLTLTGTDGAQHTLTVRNAFIGDGTDKNWSALQSGNGSMTVADTTNWGEGRALTSSNAAVATLITRFDKGATLQLNTMLVGEADGNNVGLRTLIDINGKTNFTGAKQNSESVQFFQNHLLHPENPVVDAALALGAEGADDAQPTKQTNAVDLGRTKQFAA